MTRPIPKDPPTVTYTSAGLARLAAELALQDAKSRNLRPVLSPVRDIEYAIRVDGLRAEIVVSYVVGKITYGTLRPL